MGLEAAERRYRKGLLSTSLLGLAAAFGATLAVNAFEPDPLPRVISSVANLSVVAGAWLLYRIGRESAAARVLCVGIWVAFVGNAYWFGGLSGIGLHAFALHVMVTGFLLGGSAALLAAAATVVVTLPLSMLGPDGLGGLVEPDTRGRLWIGLATALSTSGLVLYTALRSIREAACEAVTSVEGRRRAEEERAELEMRLREAQRVESLGRLAGGVAHDINNMLTLVLGNAALLLKRARLDAAATGQVSEIQDAALRASEITRQLLAFGRRQHLEPRRLDLHLALKEMGPLLARLAGEDVHLDLVYAAEQATVLVDPAQLTQVVTNLVVNARDAMSGGGAIRVSTSTHVLTSEEGAEAGLAVGPYVCLSVRDSGVGMSEATRSQVFEPFFTTKANGRGTGLGLATVEGIARQSGGTVRVESAPGEGTTFSVFLPCVDVDGVSAAPSMLPPPRSVRTRHAVIADDQVKLCVLGRTILEDAGFLVIASGTSADVLATVHAYDGPLDLIVTDVIMPGLSGPELAGCIVARYPQARVLYVSGYTGVRLEAMIQAGPSHKFLAKPYAPEVLTQTVCRMFE